jgi:ABC-type uncharacterized transport system substrate-binding protein
MPRGARALLGCLLAVLLFGHAWAREAAVWVVTSGDSPAYVEAADALARALPELDIQARPWREIVARQGGAPSVIVTLGLEALTRVAEVAETWPRTTIIALMVTRSGLESLQRAAFPRITGIYLDQPFARQLQLLRQAFPGREKIAVLLGPNSKVYAKEIRQAARQAGLGVEMRTIDGADEIAGALQGLLADADLFLAVPDGVVFSPRMIQFVLLASYRHSVPVFGYSAPLVKAGAVAAVASTPDRIGRQGAAMVRRVLDGATLPGPQAPEDYEMKFNASVARSLGIAIDDGALGKKARPGRDEP